MGKNKNRNSKATGGPSSSGSKSGKKDTAKKNDGYPNSLEPKSEQQDQKWSKSKKKRMRRVMGKSRDAGEEAEADLKRRKLSHEKDGAIAPALSIGSGGDRTKENGRKKSALHEAFMERLSGARFRELNEDLYTTNSSSALKRFKTNPELFEQYHEGFRTQVKAWPVNPINVIYKWIVGLESRRPQRHVSRKMVVADFGCGDAMLAKDLLQIKRKNKAKKSKGENSWCPFEMHSFDLVANGNPLITPCDMAKVPLPNTSTDVGIFSLALMGTNMADFIREAHRILKPDGILKIAEVRSRFESASVPSAKHPAKKGNPQNNGKDSNLQMLHEFLEFMKQLGFDCSKMDRSNKMFFLMEFGKNGHVPSKDATFTAKACLYKRR